MDTTWDDVYSANTGNTGIAVDDDMPIYQGETTQSLQDYLVWQLDLTPFTETDRAIALAIIDAVDDYGYLTLSCEDILESVDIEDVELDEVEAVRKRIQQFDPLGIASLNLQDCLLLQLATFPEDTPWLAEAKLVLTHHIDQLGNRDYKLVIKETKLKEAELREVLKLIQQLDPRPGSKITPDETEYVVPDVSVFKDRGKWVVQINPDSFLSSR
ncbi:RNA polymerase sigma-54 factor RpoN [Vibrio variabilis]|uniref:RNA polymerase sigma-54 factor n=1 Tax=Vibrio variabilis TaxID=990271 RepID=A0ABQ0JLZ5_9VIBR|nr:RNA polymerase sigma-54 factor RpoN [Vibrio variabilis]